MNHPGLVPLRLKLKVSPPAILFRSMKTKYGLYDGMRLRLGSLLGSMAAG